MILARFEHRKFLFGKIKRFAAEFIDFAGEFLCLLGGDVPRALGAFLFVSDLGELIFQPAQAIRQFVVLGDDGIARLANRNNRLLRLRQLTGGICG